MEKNQQSQFAEGALPRFNHYVPEFILSRFAVGGKVCVFDKHTLKEFKLPPKRAMGERDYNNVRMDDVLVSFEDRFTHIENLAAPVIEKIVRQKSIDFLVAADTAILHLFAIVQLMRSKSRRLDQDAITNEILKRWPDAEINPFPDRISDSELAKLSALKMTFENLDKLAEPLTYKHMFLMVRDCKDSLYISDNPLVMHNQKDLGPYGNIGLAVPGIEIYYPLSPDVVLAYICPTSINDIERRHAEAEKEISAYFGSRVLSIHGVSKSDLSRLEAARAELHRAKNYYRLLKERRVVPIDTPNALYLNSLQLSSSHRFVASAKHDFHFAKKVLRERPHWKEGVRVQVA